MIFEDEEKEALSEDYFNWMYHLVADDRYYSIYTFKKLLRQLYETEFVPTIERDKNCMVHGIDFRYRFAYRNGYSREYVKRLLGNEPCNMLEMMMSLAFRVEEQIMTNDEYGNRIGQWFWSMIASLGLGVMHDKNYQECYVSYILEKFMNHDYARNGNGGLFTLQYNNVDLRNVDIWCQCMWYLNEVIEGERKNV